MNEQERFWSKVDMTAGPDECWLWMGYVDPRGYGRFQVGGRGGRTITAHRYALGLDVQDPRHALHGCDTRACVNPAHLRPGTHADNMRDMAERERSRTTRLNAAQVEEIRRRYTDGESHNRLAAAFGVSKSNVQAITSGATWRHTLTLRDLVALTTGERP